jgi:small-conductance mechanosensitive channel
MRRRSRTSLVEAALALAVAVVLAAPLAAQTPSGATGAPAASTVKDPEADPDKPAAVLLDGEPVLWISAGAGAYSTAFRADRIGQRLQEIVFDRSIRDPTVTVIEADGSSELHVGARLLMVITPRDAAAVGAARASLAEQYARIFETAIREERLRYAPATLIRSGAYGAAATLVFAFVAWIVIRVTRAVRGRVCDRVKTHAERLGVIDAEGSTADTLVRGVGAAVFLVRAFLLVLALDLYLTFVLGMFPWTRAISSRLVDYAFTPVRSVAASLAGYTPKLLFLIVIAAVVHLAIRLVRAVFHRIGEGRIVIENFPPEWADPTNKIVRVLLIAFGLVVAFPYLPASDSPAFAGVSVFFGVLVSLSSSSALSNMIAGIVLTYTGAFRIGDRVKVGDTIGDIIETTLLATRVRTIKNEDITIPNSLALGTAVTNYTREAATRGLILHTTVTIGYDAPWRKVHELLLAAALSTEDVLVEPRPFVLQTALNDFYVSYEINAYTRVPQRMVEIYAALHANIQDTFYAAGVEIMSPHVTALRDGNTVAIPEASRPADYHAPSFRVRDTTATGIGVPHLPGGGPRRS